jgi:hypothetical protein
MKERIVVFVNGAPVAMYRGMQVRHALISHDQALYDACRRGEMHVENEDGFRVGLEGALTDGTKLYTKKQGQGSRMKHWKKST